MDGTESRTLWCGNVSDRVTVPLLEELFLQAGPVETVTIPKDRDGRQRNYGFITFVHEESVPYAMNIFGGTRLFDRSLNLQSKGNPRVDKPCSDVDKYLQGPVSPRYEDTIRLNASQVEQFGMLSQMPPPDMYAELQEHRYGDSVNGFRSDSYSRSRSNMKDLSVASLAGQWSSKNLPTTRFEPYKNDAKLNRYKETENNHGRNKYNDKSSNDHKHYRDYNSDRHHRPKERNYSRR